MRWIVIVLVASITNYIISIHSIIVIITVPYPSLQTLYNNNYNNKEINIRQSTGPFQHCYLSSISIYLYILWSHTSTPSPYSTPIHWWTTHNNVLPDQFLISYIYNYQCCILLSVYWYLSLLFFLCDFFCIVC